MPWRYRPKDNRTPKAHPVIGHLEWNHVYDNPACAGDPDFEKVVDKKASKSKPASKPVSKPATVDKPADDKPAAEKAPDAAPAAGA